MKAYNTFLLHTPEGVHNGEIFIDGSELKVVHDGSEALVYLNEINEVQATWGSLSSYGLLNQEGEFSSQLRSDEIVAKCLLGKEMGFQIMGDGKFFAIGHVSVHKRPYNDDRPISDDPWPPFCD